MLKSLAKYLIILTFPLWLLLHFIIPNFFVTSLSFFDTFYNIAVAFLASGVLLEMIERYDSPQKIPIFWLFTGIFFYNFSTFFPMILKGTELGERLWFLHNTINITTYLVYSIGFILQIKINSVQKG